MKTKTSMAMLDTHSLVSSVIISHCSKLYSFIKVIDSIIHLLILKLTLKKNIIIQITILIFITTYLFEM